MAQLVQFASCTYFRSRMMLAHDPRCTLCRTGDQVHIRHMVAMLGASGAVLVPMTPSGEVHTIEAPPSRAPIPGIRTKALRWIPDDRGRLMECLRADDELFGGFGQVYVTTAYPGVVKGWHFHKAQTDNFVVLSGMLKLVCAMEGTDGWLVNEYFIGDHNPMLVQVPPMIWHGFKCISEREALVMNVASKPYDHAAPDEYRRKAHSGEIPYDWSRNDG